MSNEGLSAATAQAFLDALFNNTTYTGIAQPYMQLHTAAPGAAGTFNTANLSGGVPQRQAISVGASGTTSGVSSVVSDAALTWNAVSTSEQYTKCSVWTASTGGTFLASGSVSAAAVTVGDNFSIAIGSMSASLVAAT